MSENQFPLDFSILGKGDVIPASVIAEITEAEVGSDKFRLGAMKLADRIRSELEEIGIFAVVKSEKNDLRILTDEEAASYTDDGFHAGLRMARRRFAAQVRVDVGNLRDETVPLHNRRIEINGRVLGAIAKESRRVALEGAKRTTPTLGEKK